MAGMALGAGAQIAGQGLSMLLGEHYGRQQVDQQKKLTKVQTEANKELMKEQQKLAMENWENTNYSAQVAQAKKAGMSISALYGGSGAGGATMGGGGGGGAVGGTAEAPSAKTGMGIQMASQLALMNAQKENIEADTENKKAGKEGTEAGTVKTGEETKAIAWENKVKEAIGADVMGKAQNLEVQMRGRTAQKDSADLDAYLAGAYEGKASDDPTSPLAKSIKAGIDQVAQTLENSKKTGDLIEAQKTIEGFKANLAKQGISPDSPWYVKILTTLLKEKFGIEVGETVKKAVK